MSYDFLKNKYSEEEIREFIGNNPEKLNGDFWIDISYYQDLSRKFIIDFQHNINWYCISYHRNLSEEFLIEFIEMIKIPQLKSNENIPEDVKQRIINLKKVIDQ